MKDRMTNGLLFLDFGNDPHNTVRMSHRHSGRKLIRVTMESSTPVDALTELIYSITQQYPEECGGRLKWVVIGLPPDLKDAIAIISIVYGLLGTLPTITYPEEQHDYYGLVYDMNKAIDLAGTTAQASLLRVHKNSLRAKEMRQGHAKDNAQPPEG